uniref:Uncharacterized protein n=1 Tax=Avena sativa TaxID=4498 RepID=A0ACD5TUE5_AVESA
MEVVFLSSTLDVLVLPWQFTKLANTKGDAGGDAGLSCHASSSDKAVVSSKAVVEELNSAVERGDADTVRRLLNPDVDWWFHGPRAHQHLVLMRLLTGGAGAAPGIPFRVRTVEAFGSTVLAEGTDATGLLYWVHAWTVGPGGCVTEVREYCNTVLLVTRLGRAATAEETTAYSQLQPRSRSQHVWQSRLPDHARRNLPALVLAI